MFFVVLALIGASVGTPGFAMSEFGKGVVIGIIVDRAILPHPYPTYGGRGPVYPQRGGPDYSGYGHGGYGYAPPRHVYVPGTTVHVGPTTVVEGGARHNADGTCTQSNGRKGIVENNMCFVAN
ncbi:MAG: hypothetical protein UY63_C0015G0010 [Parcubacteria group bacterium GW2011_GWA2_51_10]|nr:MAG: hypothetical protein UY63_C0015G0010 [Parcubacteria group bacterium GW2011_GWA2_51_10]